ncbi:MAG: oxidoreductase [Pseudomonadota bacterium]|nr:oxidoreductase [Pseudomonadota bacterium]
MRNKWSPKLAPDQTGRVAIVTGANTGLGFETARALAEKGAQVIMACRDAKRAESARQEILSQLPSAQITVELIDTGSLDSVRHFATNFQQAHSRLDLLINNAGIMITPYFQTADGFEGQLGVNYLGHFLLTGLLLPMLTATPGSRVVSLYSLAADWHGVQFDDLQFKEKYDATKAYSQSKQACLMFGLELNQRLQAAGNNTIALAAHPGYSKSDLSRHLSLPIRWMLAIFGPLILQPTADGALPTLYAALDNDLKGGEAVGPAGRKQTRGAPVVVPVNEQAQDAAARSRLWSLSEELCGISYVF